MDNRVAQLADIIPSERILLLPHCLRHSRGCRAGYDQDGLQCEGCSPDCAINRLSTHAEELGYKGVCVAPGGRLALKFIEKIQPKAIVAVACGKELEEGEAAVQAMPLENPKPLIVIIPLVKDGCVDTKVDTARALEIIGV